MKRAIFLDRDNTIVRRGDDQHDVERVTLIRGAAHALASLRHLGFRIIVVTNEGSVARGIHTEDEIDALHQRVAQLAHETAGAIVDRFYYCPFHPDGTVEEYRREHPWRKPNPGMLRQAAEDLDLDLADSWMVGDHSHDIEAGRAAGCQTILISNSIDKSSNQDAADYCVETLAEAAAVISQNRLRSRPAVLSPPIVVTRVKANDAVEEDPPGEETVATPAPPVGAAIEAALNAVAAPKRKTRKKPTTTKVGKAKSSTKSKVAEKKEPAAKKPRKSTKTAARSEEAPMPVTAVEPEPASTPVSMIDSTGSSDATQAVALSGEPIEVNGAPSTSILEGAGLTDDQLAPAIEAIAALEEEVEVTPKVDADADVTQHEAVGESTARSTEISEEPQAEVEVQCRAEVELGDGQGAVVEGDHDKGHESPSIDNKPLIAESELPPSHIALPPLQTEFEAKSQTDARSDRLLLDLLGEVRSWRASSGEFTSLRLFAFVALAVIMMGSLAAAIYLPWQQALAWVGVTVVAQLTVIAILLLNPKG